MAQAATQNKTLCYSVNDHSCHGYSMFSFFSYCDGKLNVGQSQHVKTDDVRHEREALSRNGWTEANWHYENGRPIVTLVIK